MDRETRSAVVKFSACAAVAIALLLVSCCGGDSWFRPVAIISLIVVAGPVTLLVSIDLGRVLRRRSRLGPAATIATRLPQLFLGSLACIASTGGFTLVMLDSFRQWWERILCGIVSLGMFLYGVSLLRGDSVGANDDVSS